MDQVTCQLPNAGNLQGFSVDADYNGHGTSMMDTIITLGTPLVIGLAIVLMMVVYWYHNTQRPRA